MNTLPMNVSDITRGMDIARSQINDQSGDFSFMKFNKQGMWVFGQDDNEPELDAEFAVDPRTLQMGFIAWEEGRNEPVGEEMRPLGNPVALADLSEADWTQQASMQMLCLTGDYAGEAMLFKTSSKGGMKMFKSLLGELQAQLSSGIAGDKVIPVVHLDEANYKHKKYGTIFTPVVEIVRWVTLEELAAATPEDDDDAPEPEPKVQAPKKKRATRRKAAAEPEPDGNAAANDDDAKTTRRRRRRTTTG
ncbi:unnamed protein product [marine sediment metagenome]|uniref:Uncharacterized protein n=1 Tax=marine sediment metagenome TaxID=412755 RepID=X0RJY1_9ZZZZ